jgi:uncharacterized protein YkwD
MWSNKSLMNRSKHSVLAIGRAFALALMIGSCASPPSPNVPPLIPEGSRNVQPAEPSHLIEQVVQAHNARRRKAGLGPLVPNSLLEASAVEQARDMAERQKMSHKGSDGSSPFDRMKRHGYRFVAAAENVAYGFDDVDSVMTGWIKSPGHRRNILGNFSEIGVGRVIARDGASYWCVTFGTPSDR